MNSKILEKGLLLIALVLTFLLVYSPHFSNQFPIHIDEWHHITESIKLKNGIQKGLSSTELGFHFILSIISYFADIVLIYKFLPALFALLSCLILFFIIKNKTSNLENSFMIAIFSIIFFASIKSNVNLTGLWFFTPLTFSIPFIYLYMYFFSEGIIKQNNKFILVSLVIMIFLIPIHSISVLFAIPILLIFSLFHLNYIKKQPFFLIFLLIPVVGLILYSRVMDLTILNSVKDLLFRLQFKSDWSVLEIKNSFLEVYSLVGYLLAIIGFVYITSSKEKFQKYSIYVIWPIIILIYILIFKLTNISFLSPYQRNLYYLTLSLPFLSSLGLYAVLKVIKIQTSKIVYKDEYFREKIFKIICFLFILLIIFLTFKSYFYISNDIKLYKVISKDDYEALKFLSSLKKSKVIATPEISTAIFPISNHEPLATIYFYGNSSVSYKFFNSNCNTKNQIIDNYNISYILSENPIDCNWDIIYSKKDIIYRV